jgi:hypothetical protein
MSMTPGKHGNNLITLRIFEKIKKVSKHVYWDQEEQFDKKTGGETSRDTVPLKG